MVVSIHNTQSNLDPLLEHQKCAVFRACHSVLDLSLHYGHSKLRHFGAINNEYTRQIYLVFPPSHERRFLLCHSVWSLRFLTCSGCCGAEVVGPRMLTPTAAARHFPPLCQILRLAETEGVGHSGDSREGRLRLFAHPYLLRCLFLVLSSTVQQPSAGSGGGVRSCHGTDSWTCHANRQVSGDSQGDAFRGLCSVLRGGSGDTAPIAGIIAVNALVQPHQPIPNAVTKTMRIDGSNISASHLAWSWETGAEAPRGADSMIAKVPTEASLAPAGARGMCRIPARGRGGRGRGGLLRETWTHTQVIQGPSAPVAFTGRTLFLGGTGSIVERDFWHFLEALYGKVEDVDVIRQFDQPRGFAFVTFADSGTAAQCLETGSFNLKGHTVKLSPADKKVPHRNRIPKASAAAEVAASNKVFLGGTRQLTEGVLVPMLERFGDVTSLHVCSRPENMLLLAGYAFATFNTSKEAQRIVRRGFITVANVTLEARFADECSRPGVSEKVSLCEVELLVKGLIEEIERVIEYAPGGHREQPAVEHEGIVFAPGTPFESVLSQRLDAVREPLDEQGRSVPELSRLLEDAETLRIQVLDCLHIYV